MHDEYDQRDVTWEITRTDSGRLHVRLTFDNGLALTDERCNQDGADNLEVLPIFHEPISPLAWCERCGPVAAAVQARRI